jgi:hypothetical protein
MNLSHASTPIRNVKFGNRVAAQLPAGHELLPAKMSVEVRTGDEKNAKSTIVFVFEQLQQRLGREIGTVRPRDGAAVRIELHAGEKTRIAEWFEDWAVQKGIDIDLGRVT